MISGKNSARKMTRLEKNASDRLKRSQKEAKKLKKTLGTTLNWLDNLNVFADRMTVGTGNTSQIIQGLLLQPHNIFIDDTKEIEHRLRNLQMCIKNFPDEVWITPVYSPVNIDKHVQELNDSYSNEKDETFREMLERDLDKAYEFQRRNKEIDFFVMIRNHDERHLAKMIDDLYYAFRSAGFNPRLLNKRDYYNYIQFLFENPLITDYHFSMGMLSCLNQSYIYDQETDRYKYVDSTDDLSDYGDPVLNMMQENVSMKKSRLAPTSFAEYDDYLIIGEKYVGILLVTSLPRIFPEGLLCEWLNNRNVRMFISICSSNFDVNKSMRRNLQEDQQRLMKTSDPVESEQISHDIEFLQMSIDQYVSDKDKMHSVTIMFSIYADTKEEMEEIRFDLRQNLNSNSFSTVIPRFMMDQSFKMQTPLWTKIDQPYIIRTNYGVLLSSRSVAGLYPFVFETLKDPKGFLLGQELQNAGIIIWDPAFYYHDPSQAPGEGRINGNIVVCGGSGSGKTTMMDLTIRYFIKERMRVIWIDPENSNINMTRVYGGTVVDWGKRENMINIFDLKPVSTEDDEDDEKMYDTDLAIKQVIEDVNTILQLLFPDITEDILALTGDLIVKTYNSEGIITGPDGRYPSFKGIRKEDMPTFREFDQVLRAEIDEKRKLRGFEEEVRLLNNLKIKMSRILGEWEHFFVGHTTVDLPEDSRQILSFATKKLFNAPENLQNALYYIMFKYAWTLCLDKNVNSAFVIDEAHTMILKNRIADLVAQFFRRSRKYYNIMLVGTQEPRDFADDKVLTQGKAIFNNSAYKMIMGLNMDACNDISKLTRLNESEKEIIMDFEQGQGLLVCGTRRIPVRVLVTSSEKKEMGIDYDHD